MDSKSFVIGVICGAIVGVTATWLLGDNNEKEVTSSTEPEANSPIIPHVKSVDPTTRNNYQEVPTAADQATPEPLTASESRVELALPWPANLRKELELEPKDDSWAYYMEQTLLQFLSEHSSIAQFDISSIECRTTKCVIEVIGYDESTVPVWHQVMYDIRQQPWNEFGQYGISSGIVDGRLTIVGTLQRVTKED